MKLMTIFRKTTFSILDIKRKSCILALTNSATLHIEQRTRAELLLYNLMECSKSPISNIQQIAILKERGLLIQNEE